MDHVKTLRECRCFANLFRQDLRRLASIAERRQLFQGQPIFDEGDTGDEMFVVEIGTVRLIAEDETIATLCAGAWFGEMAIISPTHERLLSAVAAETTYTLVLKRQALEEEALKNPEFGSRFWLTMAQALVRRLSASQHSVARLHKVARHAAERGVTIY